ncbi:aspartate/glutamate racemase family protein [Shewanella colwelliana]|uniref:aspartate/glutamate racemase family protein n=1 Tax=Shewanella colwelliana TaxID=23 RepID=UPI003D03BD80
MKTIGLLGGMSWESTATYYQKINQGIKRECGGLTSAQIVLNSVNFAEIEAMQHQGDWGGTAKILSEAALSVERGGADFILICTNTMHKVFDEIAHAVSIPLVHIVDATAEVLQLQGTKRIGLLGTRFTMEQAFYKGRLANHFGIETLVPTPSEQTVIHDVIYQELCCGIISETSKARYLEVITALKEQGAEAIILGCTEIALLVDQTDTDVPLYDTAALHCERAVRLALIDSV